MSQVTSELLAYIVLFTPLSATLSVALGGSVLRVARRWLDRLTIALASVSAVASLLLAATDVSALQFVLPIVNIRFYLDALSIYFLLLVNLVAFFAACYVPAFLDREKAATSYAKAIRFHILFNIFHLTMVIVPMVDNLVLLWMAVELTTLASTLLVRFRDDRPALEAAWKYLMITTTGIIFALLGTVLLLVAVSDHTGSLRPDPMSWQALSHASSETFDSMITKLAFLFALVGYGTKAGFAPMHTWLPDGHGEAPSPVSALLSGVLLKSALFAILRFYSLTNLALLKETDPREATFTSEILLVVGLFSLTVATPFILKRNRFKRLLAYHSLEHMGIIAFGLGIGTPVAVFGALLHTLNHALTKALMFLTYGHAQAIYAQHDIAPSGSLADEPLHGVLKTLPLHGGLLAMGGLALVGSPPFNIFQSEFIIVWGAITRPDNTLWQVLAIVVFLVSVTLIFGGLVVHLARLLLGAAPFQMSRERIGEIVPLLGLTSIIIVFGFAIVSWPIDFPQLIRASTCLVTRDATSLCSLP